MRINSTDRLLVSALLPSGEELADRAKEEDVSLTEAEALAAVGHYARVLLLESVEEGVALVLDGGDDGDGPDEPPPVAAFDTLLDQLVELCLGMARERLLRAPESSRDDSPEG